jgi:hypothetical protein
MLDQHKFIGQIISLYTCIQITVPQIALPFTQHTIKNKIKLQ